MASGLEPGEPAPIPESAFHSVVLGQTSLPSPASLPPPPPTPDLRQIVEPLTATAPPERAQPSVEVGRPLVVLVPTPTPRPTPTPAPRSGGGSTGGSGGSTSGGGTSSGTTRSISGYASYYCRAGVSPCTYTHPDTSGFDAYAAAGPRLREAIGAGWRGTVVTVDGIRVKLIDWCQCYKGEPHEKLLDLYYDVFRRTGSPVTVRW